VHLDLDYKKAQPLYGIKLKPPITNQTPRTGPTHALRILNIPINYPTTNSSSTSPTLWNQTETHLITSCSNALYPPKPNPSFADVEYPQPSHHQFKLNITHCTACDQADTSPSLANRHANHTLQMSEEEKSE